MLVLKDRVKELTTTTGTGTLTLVSAPSGYRRFSSVLSDGDTTFYCLESGSQWEVGLGTYTANTLERTTVLASSNSNARINITAARSFVFITYAADKAVHKDGSDRTVIGSAGLIFSDNTIQTTAATTPDLSPYLTISSAASTYVALAGSYANPDWITQLAWSKLTGVPSAVSSLSGVNTGDQDLSSYATTASVASTYVPLTRTLNGLALSSDQTFAVGTTGTDFAVVSTGTSHTFNIPDASATARGLVTTGSQTFAGAKTFAGDLLFTDATYDIGKSGATRPRDGFFSRGLGVGDGVNGVYFWAAGTNSRDMYISNAINGSEPQCVIHRVLGISIGSANGAGAINYYNGDVSTGTLWGITQFDASDTFAQRRGTNAQTFRLYETYTSSTSFGNLQFKATGSAYQIGSIKGSAGGSNRTIQFGHFDAAGTFTEAMSVNTDGTFGSSLLKTFYINYIHSPYTDQGVTISTGASGSGGTSGTSIIVGTPYVGTRQFRIRYDATQVFGLSETKGNATFSPIAATSGSPTAFTITGAAHTTLAAATESTDINFNLARTVQFSTGSLTTQRAMRIQAPTYSFVGASTITTASTLSISGAPAAGTNATITNAYALNVESGKVQFNGWTQIGGTDSWNSPLSVGNKVQMWASGYDCLIMNFGTGSQLNYHASWGSEGLQLQNRSAGFGWSSLSNNNINFDAALYSPSANIIEQRIGTNAQNLRVYNTYTSATSGEYGELRWASSVLYIGSNKGSAGGSARDVAITHGGNVVANFLADRFYLGPIADSTATGGNARGQYAVDLQLLKSSATQVASGLYSVAIGVTNVSSGENTIAIGLGNTSSNYDSVTIGKNNGAGFGGVSIGWGNTAGLSGVAIGQSNAANGDTAAAIGNRNTASGGSSFASGVYSVSDRLGQRSHASGRFAANGDAQSVLFVLRNKTTNNTPTTLFLDGSSTRLTIPSGKTMSCKVTVKGIKSDGSAKARFVRLVEITNVGGTTSLDMSPEALGTDYNPSGCVCDITEDDANDALQINVTGITGETWRWVCIVEGLEIAYGT